MHRTTIAPCSNTSFATADVIVLPSYMLPGLTFLHRTLPSIMMGLVLILSQPAAEASDLVRIEGLTTISGEVAKEWISGQLTYIEASGVSKARADDIAYFLENAIRDRGYEDALVEWKVVGAGENQIILLTVNEGQSMLITQFDITGNHALEDEAIIELLTGTTRKRLDLDPKSSVPLVSSDLETGRKKLSEFYTLLGFGDAEIDLQTIPGQAGATIRIIVVEGPEYVVGPISFPEAPASEIQEGFDEVGSEFSGKKFSESVSANLKSRVLELVVNSGYSDAVVSVEEAPHETGEQAKTVALAVSIDWGLPSSISSISVTGNTKIKSRFFDHHFSNIVGQPYSPDLTNKSVEELLETGAFETVRTSPVKQSDGSYLLDVEVEESYSRTLGIYGGFNNYDGPIGGFEFRNLNLFGEVRTINAEIEFSRRGGKGIIKYRDPWFLNSDVEFGASIFGQNRNEEGYKKWETGGNYSFSKRFGRQNANNVTLFGRAAYTDVSSDGINPIFLGDRRYFTHFVGVSYALDKRDQPQQPTKGYIAQISASVASSATGSEVEFFRTTGRLGYYLPVGEHKLRLAARAGAINPIGNTQAIPIDLRFYNGGPQTVRSFQERGLGPIDPTSGYPIGGEFYTIFNAEYQIPIGPIAGLDLVGFADAGNLLPIASSAGFTNMRYAIGLGIRYQTPIGPLRLEYGYNPDQQPGEPQGTFHVGFGFSY